MKYHVPYIYLYTYIYLLHIAIYHNISLIWLRMYAIICTWESPWSQATCDPSRCLVAQKLGSLWSSTTHWDPHGHTMVSCSLHHAATKDELLFYLFGDYYKITQSSKQNPVALVELLHGNFTQRSQPHFAQILYTYHLLAARDYHRWYRDPRFDKTAHSSQ
jgi:hypothetical protein